MLKTLRRLFRTFAPQLLIAMLAVVTLMLLAGPVLAQEAGDPLPDIHVLLSQAIPVVGAMLIPFALWGVRKLAPRIPRMALPILVWIGGLGVTAVDHLVTGGGFTLEKLALISLGAHVLREVVTTLQEHGVNG